MITKVEGNHMGEKKLVKVNEGKMVGGVCTGFAKYFGISVVAARVIVVAVSLFASLGIWAYLIAWLVMGKAED